MSEPVRKTSLYFRAPGSDKVYIVTMHQVPGGFDVNGWNGPRGGSLKQRPQTPNPVTRADADRIFDELVKDKQNHRETPYIIEPTNSSSYVPPQNTASNTEIQPQLLLAIEDGDEAALLVRRNDIAIQEKYDGDRVILIAEGSGISSYSRSQKARGIPQVIQAGAEALANKIGTYRLDGEQVGDKFFAFDALAFGGHDLRNDRFIDRFKYVAGWMQNKFPGLYLARTAFTDNAKVEMVSKLYASGAEGIALKDIEAPYIPNSRVGQWKHKFWSTASVLVTGMNRKASVRVSVFSPGAGEWVEIGNVTVRNPLKPKEGDILEVRYLNLLPGGSLYQPTMLRIRDDIPESDCVVGQLHHKGAPRKI